jgi:hypothetical protein
MNDIIRDFPAEAPDATFAPGLTHVSRIYLGRDIPRDRRVDLGSCTSRYTEITEAGVARFIREVVAHEFPDGFTVLRSEGGWRDTVSGEPIIERGIVVEVAHGHDAGAIAAIRRVAREWKRWAQQQAVMVTTEARAVAFV